MLKQLLSAIKISALALVLSFGLSYALAAWTAPTALPPDGNAAAPINVSATSQTKVGGDICTTVSGTTKCLQASLDTGATAQTKTGALTVGGVNTNTLRVSTGAAASRVLTSDSSGNATWQAAAGGSDNLGNHTATQALNMAGFNVNNAANLINTSATAQTKLGALSIGGELDATGGTGTGYSTAPIEVRTTLTPRLAFHWPGVVASQIGMDSAGTIRTYDNPGTGYANFTAAGITAVGALSSNGLTSTSGADIGNAGGAYTYVTLRDDESPNGVKYVHANSNVVGFLSGAGSWLSYWDNAGNQRNTGNIDANDVYIRATGTWASAGSSPSGSIVGGCIGNGSNAFFTAFQCWGGATVSVASCATYNTICTTTCPVGTTKMGGIRWGFNGYYIFVGNVMCLKN